MLTNAAVIWLASMTCCTSFYIFSALFHSHLLLPTAIARPRWPPHSPVCGLVWNSGENSSSLSSLQKHCTKNVSFRGQTGNPQRVWVRERSKAGRRRTIIPRARREHSLHVTLSFVAQKQFSSFSRCFWSRWWWRDEGSFLLKRITVSQYFEITLSGLM